MWNFIITPLIALFKGWLDRHQQLIQARQDLKLAELENRAALLRDKENNNAEWERAEIMQSDSMLRRVCFLILASPFIVAIFLPEAVNRYFTIALKAMPDWYIQMFVGMVGAVWGISALKNAASSISSTIFKKTSLPPVIDITKQD